MRLSTVSSVSPKYCRRSLWPDNRVGGSRGRDHRPGNLAREGAFFGPMRCSARRCRMRVPLAAATAAARSVNGGQITISQCSEFSISGRNFSKNAEVSAGVLYIFQLPAITGFLIGFVVKSWFRWRSGAEIVGHRLADIGQRRAQAQVDARPHPRPARPAAGTYSRRVIGAGDGGVAAVVGGENSQVASRPARSQAAAARRRTARAPRRSLPRRCDGRTAGRNPPGSRRSGRRRKTPSLRASSPCHQRCSWSCRMSRMPRPRKTSKILPTLWTATPRAFQPIEQHAARAAARHNRGGWRCA